MYFESICLFYQGFILIHLILYHGQMRVKQSKRPGAQPKFPIPTTHAQALANAFSLLKTPQVSIFIMSQVCHNCDGRPSRCL